MKTACFKRDGWIHLPVSVPGAILTMAMLAFCAQIFLAVDRHAHSVSDMLYGIFPFFACAFLLFDRLAKRTSS